MFTYRTNITQLLGRLNAWPDGHFPGGSKSKGTLIK